MSEPDKPQADQTDTPQEHDSPSPEASESSPPETSESTPPEASESPAAVPPAAPVPQPDAAPTPADQGTTIIAQGIVSKIASIAAREVEGVYRLVGGSPFSSFAQRVTAGSQAGEQGVQAEVGQREAAIDMRIVTVYGANIPDIAQEVRRKVIERVSEMTGLKVKEVNIEVVDLHFPGSERNGKAHGETAATGAHAGAETSERSQG